MGFSGLNGLAGQAQERLRQIGQQARIDAYQGGLNTLPGGFMPTDPNAGSEASARQMAAANGLRDISTQTKLNLMGQSRANAEFQDQSNRAWTALNQNQEARLASAGSKDYLNDPEYWKTRWTDPAEIKGQTALGVAGINADSRQTVAQGNNQAAGDRNQNTIAGAMDRAKYVRNSMISLQKFKNQSQEKKFLDYANNNADLFPVLKDRDPKTGAMTDRLDVNGNVMHDMDAGRKMFRAKYASAPGSLDDEIVGNTDSDVGDTGTTATPSALPARPFVGAAQSGAIPTAIPAPAQPGLMSSLSTLRGIIKNSIAPARVVAPASMAQPLPGNERPLQQAGNPIETLPPFTMQEQTQLASQMTAPRTGAIPFNPPVVISPNRNANSMDGLYRSAGGNSVDTPLAVNSAHPKIIAQNRAHAFAIAKQMRPDLNEMDINAYLDSKGIY